MEAQAYVIDSQPLWVAAVSQVLSRLELKVVGTGTVDSALSDPALCSADIVVADPSSDNPGEFLRSLAKLVPSARLLVLSGLPVSDRVLEEVFAAGTTAYVTKAAQPEHLAAAVRHALHGSRDLVLVPRSAFVTDETAQGHGLTRREAEILRLVAEGHSNAQLARKLWVTEQTVKFHLSNIYRKLDVGNRTEASRWAERNGLFESLDARVGAA